MAAKLVQELARLQVGPPALHRLDQHGGELIGLGPDDVERGVSPYSRTMMLSAIAVGNARCDRLALAARRRALVGRTSTSSKMP